MEIDFWAQVILFNFCVIQHQKLHPDFQLSVEDFKKFFGNSKTIDKYAIFQRVILPGEKEPEICLGIVFDGILVDQHNQRQIQKILLLFRLNRQYLVTTLSEKFNYRSKTNIFYFFLSDIIDNK